DDICDHAHAANLKVHLDGARIFNASVALGHSVADLTRKFDSVMFCLSKEIGAHVGSMLLCPRHFIDKAHIGRKLLGGGMRQIGILAAAGLIALEETPKILHRDHENARYLAEGLAKVKAVAIDPKKVATNIVIFDVRATGHTADDICSDLSKHKILCVSSDRYAIRMVTPYAVDRAGIDRALAATSEVITGRAPAAAAH